MERSLTLELRTPLHAIIGYADMLCEGALGALDAGQLEAVERIRRRAGDQYELIAAVLDLTAMDAGQLPVEHATFALNELFRELESQSSEVWLAARVPIVWRCAPDLPPLCSDPGKVKVILRNLVGNAVKFPERGVITVAARPLPEGVELHVADTGIPSDCLDTIFEPFRQVDASESRRYEGPGLGLHTVKRLAELLGRSVSVQSAPERGSTFIVRLPSLEGRPGRAAGAAPAAARRSELRAVDAGAGLTGNLSCQMHAQSARRVPRPIECRYVNFRANASYSRWRRHYNEAWPHESTGPKNPGRSPTRAR